MYPIDFFFRSAKLYPERIALQSRSCTLTYQALAEKVNALATALQAIDPHPQTRVAICAANTVDHATVILAVLASGKIWVPLNARSTQSELKRITDIIEPSIVISD
ncbi:MAG: class I adenylate-forming enzyme family protein, partial [Zwartia sp.]